MSEACLQKEPCLLEVQGLKMLFPTGGSILGKKKFNVIIAIIMMA